MIAGTARPLTRRVLIVDDKLSGTITAGARAIRTLADELRERGIEVVEALSIADGLAHVVSDAALHGIFLSWTLGQDNGKGNGARTTHAEATKLLRTLRARNATVPVFLMADRSITGTVTVEVATQVDEFIWILEDTAAFIGGRASAAIERYIQGLLPPFAAALASYEDRKSTRLNSSHLGISYAVFCLKKK